MTPFSVCMGVYQNDNSTNFLTAIRSVWRQTMVPSEIILVVDGPIGNNLENAIKEAENEINVLRTIYLPHNMGHAIARQTALDAASNEIIAIMDSDDIANSSRFEKQIKYFEQDADLSVVGGQITEFVDSEDNVVGSRIVPQLDKEIKLYMKSRCPMNLVTVMFRKEHVKNVGGYIDWYCEEDYYLWIRMMLSGCNFTNLPDTLVNVRVGKEMYSRRGGMKYFNSEARLQRYMLKHKIISLPRYIYNVLGRFVLQVLFPNSIRGLIFQKLFRK